MQAILIVVIIVSFGIFLRYVNSPKVKGRRGEKKVASWLARLPNADYSVFNDVMLNIDGYTSQIDHVVVSKYGIFVIETKNYTGWVYGSENSEKWTQNIFGNKYELPNPVKQNKGHIWSLKKYLSLSGSVQIKSIIAFSTRASIRINVQSADVVYIHQVLRTIKSYKEEVVSEEVVRMIVTQLNSIPKLNKKDTAKHISEIRDREYHRNSMIRQGKCPRCGGELIERYGKYGNFFGCSNYPYCRFTTK